MSTDIETPIGFAFPPIFKATEAELKVLRKIRHQSQLYGIVREPYSRRLPVGLGHHVRRLYAANYCADQLLATTPSERTCVITLTSRWKKDAKEANRRFAKILAKLVGPVSNEYIRFFHRSLTGAIHLHLLASLKFEVCRPGVYPAPFTESQWWAERCGMARVSPKAKRSVLSTETVKLVQNLKTALERAYLGFRTEVAPVIFPDRVAGYLCHYLYGTAKCGSYEGDKGIRLWSATKSARKASCKHQILNVHTRLRRQKCAAYCRSKGVHRFEDAATMLGASWQYHARPELDAMRLRNYLFEEDFRVDWGGHFPPEALGVRIKDPEYSPYNRKFQYVQETVPRDSLMRSYVERLFAEALECPLDNWGGETPPQKQDKRIVDCPSTVGIPHSLPGGC